MRRKCPAHGLVRLAASAPHRPKPAGLRALQGDVSLLGALAAEVLLPGVCVGVPEDLAAELAAAGGAPATAAKQQASLAGTWGRRRCSLPGGRVHATH